MEENARWILTLFLQWSIEPLEDNIEIGCIQSLSKLYIYPTQAEHFILQDFLIFIKSCILKSNMANFQEKSENLGLTHAEREKKSP